MVFLIYYGAGWIVGLVVAFMTASMKDVASAATSGWLLLSLQLYF